MENEKINHIILEPRLENYCYKINDEENYHVKSANEIVTYLMQFLEKKSLILIKELVNTYQSFIVMVPTKEVHILEVDLKESRKILKQQSKEDEKRNALLLLGKNKKQELWKNVVDKFYKQ